jgi:hypothetical protein
MANSVILELFDDDRNSIKYELLDIVNYEEIEYAVMMKQYAVDGEVEIFQLKHTKDKSATLYKPVKNDYIIMQVYEMFKEKYQTKYRNLIKFED